MIRANDEFATLRFFWFMVTNVRIYIDGYSEDWLHQKEDDYKHEISQGLDLFFLLFFGETIDVVTWIAIPTQFSCCGVFDFVVILIADCWVLQLLLIII